MPFLSAEEISTYIIVHSSRVVRAGLIGGFGVGDGGVDDGGVDEEYPAVTVGAHPEAGMVV